MSIPALYINNIRFLLCIQDVIYVLFDVNFLALCMYIKVCNSSRAESKLFVHYEQVIEVGKLVQIYVNFLVHEQRKGKWWLLFVNHHFSTSFESSKKTVCLYTNLVAYIMKTIKAKMFTRIVPREQCSIVHYYQHRSNFSNKFHSSNTSHLIKFRNKNSGMR